MKRIILILLAFLCAAPSLAQEYIPYGVYSIARTDERQTPLHKFGYNADVGASQEDIWSGGGLYTGWLQADSTVRVAAGGSADDDDGGTGCQEVTVSGLDANWDQQTATITTNGASASTATTETWIRINRAFCSEVGTYTGTPAADITLETTGGTTLAVVESSSSQTEMAIFTVPRGYKFLLLSVSFEVNASNTANINLHRRDSANDVTTPFTADRFFFSAPRFTGTYEVTFDGTVVLDEYTDFWASAIRTSGSGAEVSIDFHGYLIRM